MPSLNVLVIGASKNIGYHAAIRFLNSGATVIFLLRFPVVFDADEVVSKYIKFGKAEIVKRDALVLDKSLSYLEKGRGIWSRRFVSLVGRLTKGFIIKPANLVTQIMLNIMTTMPRTEPQPRVVSIFTMGVTNTAYAALPLPLKPLYAHLLDVPRRDKEGAERVIFHCAGWEWDTRKDGEPSEDIMGKEWRKRPGLLAPGFLKSVLIVRPALLTNGECLAEIKTSKKGYRISEDELRGYTVSRQDVAHFVVDAVLNKWSEYENRVINIAY